MYLNIKSEYSFGSVFAHQKEIIDFCKNHGSQFAGCCDINNSFGHVSWQDNCIQNGIKPIFGVTLPVFYSMEDVRREHENNMSFVALNIDGLREIYKLIECSYTNFYYKPRLPHFEVNSLSKNVLILSGPAPDLKKINHDNLYLELSPSTPEYIKSIKSIKSIACCDNYYIYPGEKAVYEAFADERKRERKTTFQFIPNYSQWLSLYPGRQDAIDNLLKMAGMIDFKITPGEMPTGGKSDDIKNICFKEAKKKNINLFKGKYKKRFDREFKLIIDKNFVSYFLIVADLIRHSKKTMLVGPARGSSAGSLVCYLLGITTVNPIKYNLLFERFIDINREDLPDIDIDFPDDKRQSVINYLKNKYGNENVAQIANISRLKPKSAMIRYSKALGINLGDIEELKDSIGESDIKKAMEKTEHGKLFIKNFPEMEEVYRIENHASHSGIHAAGVIVSSEPIVNYCGINTRENKRVAMVDKNDAEKVGLLKIDILGLRTLTIIAETIKELNKPLSFVYKIPLDDKKTYKTINDKRYTGLFQFEGESIIKLAKKIKINNIEDISTLSALCRPGALTSGGANRYIKRRLGKSDIKYLDAHKTFIKAVKKTFGVIVFQEQVMEISKNYAGLTWEEVSELRKAVAKSKGLEKFEKMFYNGAKKQGRKKQDIIEVWNDIKVHGSYSFNVSHSISYAVITFWTAYLKTHFPLEFCIATLNHTKDDVSALKFLRDMVENEGIKYKFFDEKNSDKKWSCKKGIVYGSLTSINGIGPAAANNIIKLRKEKKPFPAGIRKHLSICDSPFRYLYPAKQVYGEYYKKGKFSQPVREIKKINGKARWFFIGCLTKKNVRDMNESCLIVKRGGKTKEGQTTFLQLILEDDTDSIFCSIWPDIYDDYGKEISETGKENKDWYYVEGYIQNNQFRGINVEYIERITK